MQLQKLKKLSTLSKQYVDPHPYPDGVAFQDSQYIPVSEAKISILDFGFLHSDATYDTASVWDGAFFRLDLHLERFFSSLEKLRLSIPYSRDQLTDILINCVALSGHRNAYVEMICTRGCSTTFSRDPRDSINRFIAFSIPLGSIANTEQMERGLHIVISDIVRIPPKSVDSEIKNYHWLDFVRGLFDAYEKNGETVLLLDENGNISEGPGFNVFIVENDRLATPEHGVLQGITRRTVFDLCAHLSLDVTAQNISCDSLLNANEVFITSTAGGIMPVSQVNGSPIGSGNPGNITKKIKELYWKMHRHPEWSLPVCYPE